MCQFEFMLVEKAREEQQLVQALTEVEPSFSSLWQKLLDTEYPTNSQTLM